MSSNKKVKTPPYSVEDIFNVLSENVENISEIVLHIDVIEAMNYDLDKIFKESYSKIIYIPDIDPEVDIGHFTLLTSLSNDKIEFFNSFGDQNDVPEPIIKLAQDNNLTLITNKTQLQHDKSFICGKYCILRLRSLPSSLNTFVDILNANNLLTPDQIVDSLVKTKYLL